MKTYEEHLIARLRNGALVDENLRDEAADYIEEVVAENEKLHNILGKVADLEYYKDWATQEFVFRLAISDMLDEEAAMEAIAERVKFLIKNRESKGGGITNYERRYVLDLGYQRYPKPRYDGSLDDLSHLLQ